MKKNTEPPEPPKAQPPSEEPPPYQPDPELITYRELKARPEVLDGAFPQKPR